MRLGVLFVALVTLYPLPASAGKYYAMEQFARSSTVVADGAIIHPVGYTNEPGESVIEVKICVDPTELQPPIMVRNEQLVGPTQRAIQLWNELTPTTANCGGTNTCEIAEGTFPSGSVDLFSTVLHEIGHCGMGLGHPNFFEIADAPFQDNSLAWHSGACDVDGDGCCLSITSYTAAVNPTSVIDFSGVRGDEEDDPQNQCPFAPGAPGQAQGVCTGGEVDCSTLPRCCPDPAPSNPINVLNISWFLEDTNDPFTAPLGDVDQDTFTRNRNSLPGQDNYARNANRAVGEALGFQDTQSVMYSPGTAGRKYLGLTSDDVNMVRMGMSGEMRNEGDADDYSIQLRYQSSCEGADVRVRFKEFPGGDTDATGQCVARIQESFPQGIVKLHWTMVKASANEFLEIEMNQDRTWDFGDLIFEAGFEAGDTREWSEVVP